MLETNTTRPSATRRGEGMLSHQHPTKCPSESADDFACLRPSPDGRSLASLATSPHVPNFPSHEISPWPFAPSGPVRPKLWSDCGIAAHDNNNRPGIIFCPAGGLVATTSEGFEYVPAAADQPTERRAVAEVKAIFLGSDGRVWAAVGREVQAFALPVWRLTARWANEPEDRRLGQVFLQRRSRNRVDLTWPPRWQSVSA